MQEFHVNRNGFVTNYLVCGPLESPFTSDKRDSNQLHFEKYLRSVVAAEEVLPPVNEAFPGDMGPEGRPWRYWFSHGDWFVDFSTFYSVPARVELSAATVLRVREDMEVRAVLWTYMTADIFCNAMHIGRIDPPVYKPINRLEFILPLRKGENSLYLKLQNLGVRDTRSLFGLQLLEHRDEVCVCLPGRITEEYARLEQWLEGIHPADGWLVFAGPAPANTTACFTKKAVQFENADPDEVTIRLDGKKGLTLIKNLPHILISCRLEDTVLTRHLEMIADIKPLSGRTETGGQSREEIIRENYRRILERIAKEPGTRRNGGLFAMPNLLARKALHTELPEDGRYLNECLIPLRDRYDCSDFTMGGLLRYLHNYEVEEETKSRIKEAILGYRYWMDQDGADGMCFWSENHALMFYSCAMTAGAMYPFEWFSRAGMTGRQLMAFGERRVGEWLDCVEKDGFEEFLSTGYLFVTFAGLLNVIDYGKDALARRAETAADRLLTMLAMHAFQGTPIAPMGRVYRGVLYPFQQPSQVLLNMINPSAPFVEDGGEGWAAFTATTRYRPPAGLAKLMEEEIHTSYSTGNALICLCKTKDYCLTSAQSPREDGGFVRWENLTLKPDADTGAHAYTRSLNERFHGTTCFEPGVYGYQQHLWYAALAKDTLIFTNHPGGTCDSSSMRPGYWYGNGVLPALKQEGNMLGVIYSIPAEHPVHFTHLFWPKVKFDRTHMEGRWFFGARQNGYVCIWCSGSPEPFGDQLFDCEYRVYGSDMAYLCLCGSRDEHPDLESFMDCCRRKEPVYDKENRCLTAIGFQMQFVPSRDRTQYV